MIFGSARDKVVADIRERRAKRYERSRLSAVADKELSESEAGAGEAAYQVIMTSADASSIGSDTAKLKEKKKALEKAKLPFRQALTDLTKELDCLEATELRAPNPEKGKEIARIRATIQKGLHAADDAAGLPRGSHCRAGLSMFAMLANKGMMADGRYVNTGLPPNIPLSRDQVLEMEVADAERRATVLEQRPVVLSGEIVGDSEDELLAQESQPGFLGPVREQIKAWFEQKKAWAEQEWGRFVAEDLPEARRATGVAVNMATPAMNAPPPPHTITHRLAWDQDGEIDLQRSEAVINVLPLHVYTAGPPKAA